MEDIKNQTCYEYDSKLKKYKIYSRLFAPACRLSDKQEGVKKSVLYQRYRNKILKENNLIRLLKYPTKKEEKK